MALAERGRDPSAPSAAVASASAAGMVRSASTPATAPSERLASAAQPGPKPPSGLRVNVHLTGDTSPAPNEPLAAPAVGPADTPRGPSPVPPPPATAAPIPIRPAVAPPPASIHTDPLSPGALADMYPGPRFSIASSPPPLPPHPGANPPSMPGRHPRRASRRSRQSITLSTPVMPLQMPPYGFNMYPYPLSPPIQAAQLDQSDSAQPRSPRSDGNELYWPPPLALLSPLIGSPTSDDPAPFQAQQPAQWWGWQWPAVPAYPDPSSWSPGPTMGNLPPAPPGAPPQPMPMPLAGAGVGGRHTRATSNAERPHLPHPPPPPWAPIARDPAAAPRGFEPAAQGGAGQGGNNNGGAGRRHRHTRSAGGPAGWPPMAAPLVPFGGVSLAAGPPAYASPHQHQHHLGSHNGPQHMLPHTHPNRSTGARRPEQFKGEVVRMAMDQLGSRRLQDALDRAASETRLPPEDGEDATTIILTEVLPQAKTLMHDVFGNYVIQKLLEHGTFEQRTKLLFALDLIAPEDGDYGETSQEEDPSNGDLSSIARHTYACRVLQRALNYVTRLQAASLAVRLLLAPSLSSETTEEHVRTLATDQNANHVLQKFVAVLAPGTDPGSLPIEPCAEADAALTTLVQAFLGRVHVLATHAYACRVLQRLLERLPARTTRPLVNEVRADALKLMQDAYGNYVVQWLLQRNTSDASPSSTPSRGKSEAAAEQEEADAITADHEAVLRLVLDPSSPPDLLHEVGGPKRFVRLARHKFASNVLEYVASTAKDHTPASDVPRPSGPDAAPGAFFRLILDILLSPVPSDEELLSSDEGTSAQPTVVVLLHDQYANYVLQRVLNLVEPSDKALLAQVLRPALRASNPTSPSSRTAKLMSMGQSPMLGHAGPGPGGQASFASAAAAALHSTSSSPAPPGALSPALRPGSQLGSPALGHTTATTRGVPGLPPVPHGHRSRARLPVGTDHPPKHIATIERLLEV